MKSILGIWPVIAAGAVIFGTWESALAIFTPDGFVLPPPSAIVASFFENFDAIWIATKVTGFIVITGLLAGVFLAVLAALLVTRFRLGNETITPLAVAVNAIPIVALAPIFNIWFGLLSPRSNQAIVLALVFFPIFINTTRGLSNVEPNQIELMRSYAATEWTITRKVRVPNALPYFFTGLELATSLAVIAAIVAEYFGGRQDALGNLITGSAALAQYDDAWSAVVAGTLIGLMLFAVVQIIQLAHPSIKGRRDT